MWFTRTLKKTDLCWLFLIISLFVFLPLKVFAICWDDPDPAKAYPNVGGSPQPIAGFPNKGDLIPDSCEATADACTVKGNVAANAGYGCPTGICCLKPAKSIICYNNYVGADRPSFQSVSCVKTDALCASPNKKLGDGGGCTDANGGTVCCAIIKAGTSAGGKGAAIPQTGSTAVWQYQNPEKTGLLLVQCTQSGNCTIDDLVNQGINFAKWIMGLAGALFLLVFVYGGAMYVASFGKSDYVTKGKKALIRGAIGIVLVMGAWTIVSYVATSLGYKATGLGGTPTDQTAQCANDATAMRGCVAQSAKCLDWCNQVFIETTLSSKDVPAKCSDGPANACTSGQKCCVLAK